MRVTKDVEKDIDGCNLYQRIKNQIKVSAEKLKLSEIPVLCQKILFGENM